MKAFKTSTLAIFFFAISHLILAQAPVKQYCGGNNGAVQTPAHALGTDLSNFSTLKLRMPSAKKDFVYQNFVFAPEAVKDSRVVFVIQTDDQFSMSNNTVINLSLYTLMGEGSAADTVNMNDVQITKVNQALGLYEFSFTATKKFDTAGIVLQGGGPIRMTKIYKVYLAINNTQAAPFHFCFCKKIKL